MQFRMLVFPAPLGPMNAWMVRGATSKLTPDRAASPPNESLRFSTPRIAPMLVRERLGDRREIVGELGEIQLHRRPLPGVLDVAVEVGQRRQAETPRGDDPGVLLEIVPPHLVVRAALETPAPIPIALRRAGAAEERHGHGEPFLEPSLDLGARLGVAA